MQLRQFAKPQHLARPKSRANNHYINHYVKFTCTKTWGNTIRRTPTLQEKHPRKWIQIAKWKRKKYPNVRTKVSCCSRRRRCNADSKWRRRAWRRICDGGSRDWIVKMHLQWWRNSVEVQIFEGRRCIYSAADLGF